MTSELPEPCSLPYEPGPCKASILRYYYSTDSHQCETFTYGGCGGNDNNFRTLKGCQKICESKFAIIFPLYEGVVSYPVGVCMAASAHVGTLPHYSCWVNPVHVWAVPWCTLVNVCMYNAWGVASYTLEIDGMCRMSKQCNDILNKHNAYTLSHSPAMTQIAIGHPTLVQV